MTVSSEMKALNQSLDKLFVVICVLIVLAVIVGILVSVKIIVAVYLAGKAAESTVKQLKKSRDKNDILDVVIHASSPSKNPTIKSRKSRRSAKKPKHDGAGLSDKAIKVIKKKKKSSKQEQSSKMSSPKTNSPEERTAIAATSEELSALAQIEAKKKKSVFASKSKSLARRPTR
ncbi:hypothetical protein M3Y98_00340600 [Aphelenchoides besseyi]|nr:hypothetical protein M3Y98_00340600 [Aphelenchoides besseyi]KAI6194425.1 hypothetical protein M3Y96_01123200 [Aphelenchoides besseyi]